MSSRRRVMASASLRPEFEATEAAASSLPTSMTTLLVTAKPTAKHQGPVTSAVSGDADGRGNAQTLPQRHLNDARSARDADDRAPAARHRSRKRRSPRNVLCDAG